MNDKDKEAFENWFGLLGETHLERVIKLNRGASHKAWQDACEHKEAENKKLREALEFYANTFTYSGNRAREALKETTTN